MAASWWEVDDCHAGVCSSLLQKGELCQVSCGNCGHGHSYHVHDGRSGGCSFAGTCSCRRFDPEPKRTEEQDDPKHLREVYVRGGRTRGKAVVKAIESRLYSDKDKLFRDRQASGDWPQDSCDQCAILGHCCIKYSHHHGDCCTHCGNDERQEGRWGRR